MIKVVTHAQLGPVWYHSEPSDVPYCPNQFLALDISCRFLQQDCPKYVDLFYNIDCLELKLMVPTKFKTVPPGLCPEASLNYDEGKLTRELALW